jgi:uncharacterized protein
MQNPFKFGTVVSESHFTNRKEELVRIKSILESSNHLTLISPRRYGKTSLIFKVVKDVNRPVIYLDLQLVSSISDFAGELLKRIFKFYPYQKLVNLIKNFNIIPSLNLNPVSNEISVSFSPVVTDSIILTDVLNLLDNISKENKKAIVVFDEFQDIKNLDKKLDKKLRSIMQHHKNINYIFLGSQESMMRELFERKKSPFYHFSYVLNLDKISFEDFLEFLNNGFKLITEEFSVVSKTILDTTDCHPFYTQQLAFTVWEIISKNKDIQNPVDSAINQLVSSHDYDYERIWNNFKNTDKTILLHYSSSEESPMKDEVSSEIGLASSTIFSSISRLTKQGYLIREKSNYSIDDPFFKLWILKRRKQYLSK